MGFGVNELSRNIGKQGFAGAWLMLFRLMQKSFARTRLCVDSSTSPPPGTIIAYLGSSLKSGAFWGPVYTGAVLYWGPKRGA